MKGMEYGAKDVRRTIRHRLQELRSYPNVRTIAVGEKNSGGCGERRLAIRFIVARKVARAKLSTGDRIPRRVRGVLPGGHRYAFEFRDPTWFHQETWSLLEKYKAAWCVYDLAEVQSPERLTCDFGYLRLHGPASQKYSGRYTRAQLRRWLEACRQWLEEGARQVYIYFDNDQSGYAAQNAADMRKLAAALEV